MKLSKEQTISLCELIEEFGMTNREFATKLGIEYDDMKKIESGQYEFNDEDLDIIANIFETDEFYED